MMIAVCFILYFALLFISVTPMYFGIATVSLGLPLIFGGIDGMSLADIAVSFIEGATKNNTGITILLFVISGDLMARGQVTEKIFNIFAYFLGKRKGFMPILSILTCMFYGAISGSGPATTVAVGAMCYPLLVQLGYERLFSAAILVTAGCLGMVIPPSVVVTAIPNYTNGLDVIVLYKLAAVVGVASGVMMILYCYFYCLRHGNGDQAKIDAWVDGLRAKGLCEVFRESVWSLLIPVLILGSIFSGIADTAEAAVLAMIYALIISMFVYKSMTISDIINEAMSSLQNNSALLLMLAFAQVLVHVIGKLNIAVVLSSVLNSVGISGIAVMIGVLIYQFIMGAVGAGAGISVVLPIAYPLMVATGMDPYTCSTACMLMQAIGLTTPPIGMCLFAMTGMAKCDVMDLAKPLIPYIAILLIIAVFLILCPGAFAFLTAGAVLPGI